MDGDGDDPLLCHHWLIKPDFSSILSILFPQSLTYNLSISPSMCLLPARGWWGLSREMRGTWYMFLGK